MSKHTPGPWFCGTDKRQIESSLGVIIANVSGALSNPSVISDANLIAAAPELLEALEGMVVVLEPAEGDFNPSEQIAMDEARAAIAKARGDA